MEKSKKVLQTEEIFRKIQEGDRSGWANQAKLDFDFYLGKQWKTEDAQAVEAANQAVLAKNKIIRGISQVTSQLSAKNPRFTTIPVEDSDVNTAHAVSELAGHIWRTSKGNVRIKRAIRDYEITGLGALMAYVDPYADFGKGEILIKDVNPLDLYIDPYSQEEDSSDASNIYISQVLTERQVKVLLPEFDLKDAETCNDDERPSTDRYAGEGQITDVTDDTYKKYRVLDRYERVKVKRYHIIDPNSNFERIFDKEDYIDYAQRDAFISVKMGKETPVTDEYEVKELMELYEATGGVYHVVIQDGGYRNAPGAEIGGQNEVPNSTTMLKLTTIGELIREGYIKLDMPKIDRIRRHYTIGGKEVIDYILPVSNYPIVTFKLYGNRNPFPMGDVRATRPYQEQINKIASIIMQYYTMIANMDVFLPTGFKNLPANKDFEARKAKPGMHVWEYDAEDGGVPIFAQVSQMGLALHEEQDRLYREIEETIGAYAFQDGQSGNAPNTYRGTLAIDEFQQRRVRSKREDIEASITQLGKVIVEWIPEVYTERKVVRIIKANGQTKETVINEETKDDLSVSRIINDVTVGKYDLQVVSGSMLDSNRWAELEMLRDMWKDGLIVNRKTVLVKTDIDGIEDEVEAGDTITQLQSQLSQMDAEIKKLSGDLQTANRAEVQSRKKVEVEKFKSDLDRMGNEVKSSAKVAQLRMNDETKASKAETKK